MTSSNYFIKFIIFNNFCTFFFSFFFFIYFCSYNRLHPTNHLNSQHTSLNLQQKLKIISYAGQSLVADDIFPKIARHHDSSSLSESEDSCFGSNTGNNSDDEGDDDLQFGEFEY